MTFETKIDALVADGRAAEALVECEVALSVDAFEYEFRPTIEVSEVPF
jgi:hypothetical protein